MEGGTGPGPRELIPCSPREFHHVRAGIKGRPHDTGVIRPVPAVETIARPLPEHIDRLVLSVLKAACSSQLTLAAAESCTGGLLASLLTDVPGCSHAFDRGFVVYTDEAKHEMLGVPTLLLNQDGAVSESVARAMAEGALARSRAHIAVAITGYAESPEGCEGRPGLVHFACARHGVPTLHRRDVYGDVGRAEVRLRCLETSLRLLARQIG